MESASARAARSLASLRISAADSRFAHARRAPQDWSKQMSRDEVIGVIRRTTEELGRVPSMNELVTTNRLRRYDLRKHFAVYTSALEACGLHRHGQGYELSLATLFTDWSELVRRLGKAPTMAEYAVYGQYSPKALSRHFGGWPHIPAGMAKYAREHGLEDRKSTRLNSSHS